MSIFEKVLTEKFSCQVKNNSDEFKKSTEIVTLQNVTLNSFKSEYYKQNDSIHSNTYRDLSISYRTLGTNTSDISINTDAVNEFRVFESDDSIRDPWYSP